MFDSALIAIRSEDAMNNEGQHLDRIKSTMTVGMMTCAIGVAALGGTAGATTYDRRSARRRS